MPIAYLLPWRAGWKLPLPSPHSCLLKQQWRHRSSLRLGWCQPWPGPGTSLEEPHVRRSRNACHRSAPVLLTRSWFEGSRGRDKQVGKGRGRLLDVILLLWCSVTAVAMVLALRNHILQRLCVKLLSVCCAVYCASTISHFIKAFSD